MPAEQWQWILDNHPILRGLTAQEDTRLRELVSGFLRRKRFELRGVSAPDGGEDDAETPYRLVVAAQACLPILGLGLEWYRNWRTIVLLPEEFSSSFEETDDGGVVREWEEEVVGEAWEEGPIVLSWADVEASGWGDGFNVVIHEAAHKLDLIDRGMNGRPPLHRDMDPAGWHREFSAAYERLHQDGGGPVDSYAAESPAEFFAVTSELFFEQPDALHAQFAGVYGQLKAFYRQDPLRRRRA